MTASPKQPLAGKKLGVLLSAAPEHPNFMHCVRLVEAAIERGVEVYLYCIDEAVAGLDRPELQSIRARGIRLFGCAYSCQRRQIPMADHAVYGGLTMVSDIIAGTDRFISFN
jgi:hypothetical protein